VVIRVSDDGAPKPRRYPSRRDALTLYRDLIFGPSPGDAA
jgi:hypothetical protein